MCKTMPWHDCEIYTGGSINDWRWILASVSSVYPKSGHLDYVGSACKLQCTGAHAVTYFYEKHIYITVNRVIVNVWVRHVHITANLQSTEVRIVSHKNREIYGKTGKSL